MPPDNRIRRRPDLLPGDLSQAKLDTLSREFDSRAQDSAAVRPFFVLHHAGRRLSAALEGEAVPLARFHELTAGLAEEIALILGMVEQAKPVDTGLEKLVVALFRS